MVAWRASDSRGVWSGWLVGLFGLFWLALHGFGLELGQGFSCELQVNAIGGEMSSRNWGWAKSIEAKRLGRRIQRSYEISQ